MNRMMAYCGLMCDECPAYKAPLLITTMNCAKKQLSGGVKCITKISGQSTQLLGVPL